ncbi:MAG: histidine kinase [Alphaproteobacteria bacterium]
MTKFLVTPENPTGWKLEDILAEIQNDIIRRSYKLIDDHRPEARAVLKNNFTILTHLSQAIERAQDSTRIVNTLGPPTTDGHPRLGRA